jgi:hypothetical protein
VCSQRSPWLSCHATDEEISDLVVHDLQVHLTGPALGPHADAVHRLSSAAITSGHGPLLGTAFEALSEDHPGKAGTSPGKQQDGQVQRSSKAHPWRLRLQHGSVNDLHDERCVCKELRVVDAHESSKQSVANHAVAGCYSMHMSDSGGHAQAGVFVSCVTEAARQDAPAADNNTGKFHAEQYQM